jgi:hypothetical protein
MTYVIDKSTDDLKLSYYNVNITGLDITPKNGYPGVSYKASKVTIIDPTLSTTYIKKRINKKIDKLIKFMLRILSDTDSTDGDVGMVLDEISRLKGIVFTKYKEHMKIEDYKNLLSKIIIVEEEFKKNYNQKMFIRQINNRSSFNDFEENISEGRSR